MNGWIQRMVVASLLCGLTWVGSAQAEGGRIIFSGAVVVPTCAANESGAGVMTAVRVPATHQFICNGKRGTARDSASAASYGLSVVSLGRAQSTGNPLLEYFAGYLGSSQAVDARIITRTYE